MGELKMKLTKQLLREMVMKEMSLMTEADVGIEAAKAALASQHQQGGPYTVAMVSAENPPNMPADWNNQQKMADLKADMDKQGLSYYKIEGQYFNAPEDSYLVINAPKASIVWLGKKYLQDSVIWGEKQRSMVLEDEPSVHFRFHFIECKPELGPKSEEYEITDQRDVILNDASIQAREDMFSRIGKDKFVIPFFTDDKMRYKANVRPEKITKIGDREVGGIYEGKK